MSMASIAQHRKLQMTSLSIKLLKFPPLPEIIPNGNGHAWNLQQLNFTQRSFPSTKLPTAVTLTATDVPVSPPCQKSASVMVSALASVYFAFEIKWRADPIRANVK